MTAVQPEKVLEDSFVEVLMFGLSVTWPVVGDVSLRCREGNTYWLH